jgi:hypothetical protein
MVKLTDTITFWSGRCSPVSSTNKTDHHDIAEILLKVALNTIKQANNKLQCSVYKHVLSEVHLTLIEIRTHNISGDIGTDALVVVYGTTIRSRPRRTIKQANNKLQCSVYKHVLSEVCCMCYKFMYALCNFQRHLRLYLVAIRFHICNFFVYLQVLQADKILKDSKKYNSSYRTT